MTDWIKIGILEFKVVKYSVTPVTMLIWWQTSLCKSAPRYEISEIPPCKGLYLLPLCHADKKCDKEIFITYNAQTLLPTIHMRSIQLFLVKGHINYRANFRLCTLFTNVVVGHLTQLVGSCNKTRWPQVG